MTLFELFDLGYNILEKYDSDDLVAIQNQYKWELYVLKNNNTDEDTYKGNILGKAIEILNKRIVTLEEFRQLELFYKSLCYKTKYLNDDEVRLGNLYSKWKYPTKNVLLIDSIITDLLLLQINRKDKNSCTQATDNINIHLIDDKDIVEKNNEKFYQWKHGCQTLSNQLGKFVEQKGFLFVNNCYGYHWNFLFGFYEESKDGNGNGARVYLFDSMNGKNRECSDNQPTIIPDSNEPCTTQPGSKTRLLSLIKLMKLFLFVNRYSIDGKKDIIIDKENHSIFIHQSLQKEIRSLYSVTNVNHVYVSQQNDAYSCGLHVINYFHSMLKLIHNNQSSEKYTFDATGFDAQLRSLKAFKHHPTEYRQISSDLLDFMVNFKFI